MLKESFIRYLIFSYITVWLSGCGMSKKEKRALEEKNISEFSEYHIEEDSLFTIYKDSLKNYFSPLEIDLIRQYKINHENLRNEEDFYFFYRNARTLKKALSRKFHKNAIRIRKANAQLYSIDWFKELAQGMDIAITHKGLTYEVFFDYMDFRNHAEKTMGDSDDSFIKLLEMSYSDHSAFPKWKKSLSEYEGCSILGSGLHYKILKNAQSCQEKSDLFKIEIQKIKKDVISNILNEEHFCLSTKAVVREINRIVNELQMEEEENKLLRERTKEALENIHHSIQFDCASKNCTF